MSAKDKARAIGEAARTRAEEIGEAARAGAEAAFESVRDAAEDGLDVAHRYLRRQWRERPITVAATAAGVGLVLGLLLAGRRR